MNSKKTVITILVILLALTLFVAMPIAIYHDVKNYAKEDRFCEDKGMARLPNRQGHVQCITEDGDIRHFSRHKVKLFANGEVSE